MQKLVKFDTFQTAKFLSVVYFLVAAVFCVPMALFTMIFGGSEQFGGYGMIVFIIAPFGYALITFVMVAIGCGLYNLTAKGFGGIAFTLESSQK